MSGKRMALAPSTIITSGNYTFNNSIVYHPADDFLPPGSSITEGMSDETRLLVILIACIASTVVIITASSLIIYCRYKARKRRQMKAAQA